MLGLIDAWNLVVPSVTIPGQALQSSRWRAQKGLAWICCLGRNGAGLVPGMLGRGNCGAAGQ